MVKIDLTDLPPNQRVDAVREGLRRHDSCNFTCGSKCFQAAAVHNGPSDVLLHFTEGDVQYPCVPDYTPLPPNPGESMTTKKPGSLTCAPYAGLTLLSRDPAKHNDSKPVNDPQHKPAPQTQPTITTEEVKS